MSKVKAFLSAVWNAVASEPAVTVGIVVAAVNTATDRTWKGYAAAVGIALFRFAVSPALPKL